MFGVDDMLIGAGISAGASYLGGQNTNNQSMENQLQAQQFNAKESQNAKEAALYMSNTAYQRSMADMKAAGLNPILAYMKGGASGFSGGQASSPAPAPVVDKLGHAVSSAMAGMRLKAELDNMKETNKNLTQQNSNLKADEQYRQMETIRSGVEASRAASETRRTESDTEIKREVLQQARREASKATTDKEFFDSPFGKIVRMLGQTGKELNPFVSTSRSVLRDQ